MRRFVELDSTNRYLLDQARHGAPEGTAVVADHQTAGRGRRGRSWLDRPGSSLLLSVLLRPELPHRRLHLATAAMALAACSACERETGFLPSVKWPNDVMAGERKLAGVLAETELPAVVVGIGLNLEAPALPGPPGVEAAGLSDVVGRSVGREALLDRLLQSLGERLGDWERVAEEYRRRCATLGRTVRVQLVGETFTGEAVDLDRSGGLVVDVGGRLRTVVAGDVVHLRPAREPGPA